MDDILSRFRLDDRVAIVTGGGRGIGRAVAMSYARVGAQLVIAELDKGCGEAVAQEISNLGGRSLPVVTNVTDARQISRLVETTMKEFGRIDILVNNVGGSNPLTPVVNITDEDWDRFIRLNLTSVFLASRAVSRVMVAQSKGNIINISSIAGTRAVPGLAPYAAAKSAIINFTKTLSVELARYNIRVNCIIPGAIDTELGAAIRGTAQERAERAGIPLGRVGLPEDVALAAIYLAADASDYVSGTCIEVKGGPFTRKGDLEMFIDKFPSL